MCIYTVVIYLYFVTVQSCEYTFCEFMQNVLYKLDLIIITRVPMCGWLVWQTFPLQPSALEVDTVTAWQQFSAPLAQW